MIVRPRLNDYYNIPLSQTEVDFAIPFLDEDIPLYVDPFLLWKSPSQMDNSLHQQIIHTFNKLGELSQSNKNDALAIMKYLSECDEVGLGNSKQRHGLKIGDKLANEILRVYEDVPQIQKNGLEHIESIQLLVEDFSKDRISDITCNLIKSFLIDYTTQMSEKYEIPTSRTKISVFDVKTLQVVEDEAKLPINPETKVPVILVPKRWLRHIPWISFDDYFSRYLINSEQILQGEPINRIEILEYNRKNFNQVQLYIQRKKLEQKDCFNDPLFSQIPILSSKRKIASILKLPTGKVDNADKEYEKDVCPLLASMLYPELDFATSQSRTDSGVLIRDLIFYNNISNPFLRDISEKYGCRQLVLELKNVNKLETNHVNQLNRYLNSEFGNFGILITRNKPPKNVFQNTIDLWAGQRKCIIILDDTDLQLMCQVYEDKQRLPLDVVNKKYRDFIRACPS